MSNLGNSSETSNFADMEDKFQEVTCKNMEKSQWQNYYDQKVTNGLLCVSLSMYIKLKMLCYKRYTALFVNCSVQNGVFGYISEGWEHRVHRRKVF